MTNTITHWINNKPYAGTGGNTSPVTNPATGEVTGEVALASVEDARAVIDAAAAAFPAWRDTSLAKRTHDPVQLPRAAQRPQGRAGRDHHQRARQGGLRRARRGQPRPGGRRIRLRHPASAQGRVHRERLDQGRRLLDPPAARARSASSARSTSRPWCRCGSSPSPSPPATPSCSSRRRRTRRRRCGWPSCGPKPVCRPGVFNVLQGDKTAVDELLTNKAIKSVSLRRAPRRSRSTSTKPAPRTVSGCRPSAGRRTTR